MSETSHHLWGQTRLVQTSSMMVPQTKRPTKLVLYHPWCCCHVICYPGQWNTWQSQGWTVAWWVTNRDQAPSHNIMHPWKKPNSSVCRGYKRNPCHQNLVADGWWKRNCVWLGEWWAVAEDGLKAYCIHEFQFIFCGIHIGDAGCSLDW